MFILGAVYIRIMLLFSCVMGWRPRSPIEILYCITILKDILKDILCPFLEGYVNLKVTQTSELLNRLNYGLANQKLCYFQMLLNT